MNYVCSWNLFFFKFSISIFSTPSPPHPLLSPSSPPHQIPYLQEKLIAKQKNYQYFWRRGVDRLLANKGSADKGGTLLDCALDLIRRNAIEGCVQSTCNTCFSLSLSLSLSFCKKKKTPVCSKFAFPLHHTLYF